MERRKYHFKCPKCGFEVIASSYPRTCAKCETQMKIIETIEPKEEKKDETKN